jgi:hypothetical protein
LITSIGTSMFDDGEGKEDKGCKEEALGREKE